MQIGSESNYWRTSLHRRGPLALVTVLRSYAFPLFHSRNQITAERDLFSGSGAPTVISHGNCSHCRRVGHLRGKCHNSLGCGDLTDSGRFSILDSTRFHPIQSNAIRFWLASFAVPITLIMIDGN